jgi:hypothetical protein
VDLPPTIYRYRPINLYTLSELSESAIFCADPTTYNDPYDCALDAGVSSISDEEVIAFCKTDAVNEPRKKFILGFAEDPRPSRVALRTLRSWLERRLYCKKGTACFASKFDNLLMWGHYSDSHRGLCLEYATSLWPFDQLKPVSYKDDIPQVDKAKFLAGNLNEIEVLLLRKAECWRYEEEWRYLHEPCGDKVYFSPNALKAVHFGSRMSEANEHIVREVLKGRDVQFYKMVLNNRAFQLGRVPVTHIPDIVPSPIEPAAEESTPHLQADPPLHPPATTG